MKVQYDAKENAMYIALAKGKYNKSRKISNTILVDEDENGKILGIEILEATKNIAKFDPHKTKLIVQTS